MCPTNKSPPLFLYLFFFFFLAHLWTEIFHVWGKCLSILLWISANPSLHFRLFGMLASISKRWPSCCHLKNEAAKSPPIHSEAVELVTDHLRSCILVDSSVVVLCLINLAFLWIGECFKIKMMWELKGGVLKTLLLLTGIIIGPDYLFFIICWKVWLLIMMARYLYWPCAFSSLCLNSSLMLCAYGGHLPVNQSPKPDARFEPLNELYLTNCKMHQILVCLTFCIGKNKTKKTQR